MDDSDRSTTAAADALLARYDESLPHVYGYLLRRCGSVAVAEDLTSETFLAAVDQARRRPRTEVSTAWLITVARNKLVDHWRRREREERHFHAVVSAEPTEIDWDVRLDADEARRTLEGLGAHHRGALTLRYLDDLPVPEVARLLGRTTGATEVLLVRARRAFRSAHESEE